MSLVRMVGVCVCVVPILVGCRTPRPSQCDPDSARSVVSASTDISRTPSCLPAVVAQPPSIRTLQQETLAVVPSSPTGSASNPTVIQAAYRQPTGSEANFSESFSQAPAQVEFCLPEFLAEVQARNPSLQAMFAAAQAAAEKYPQVVALDDPMFNANLAPASLGSNQVETAYTLELSQKFPWFGKRAARGRSAKADATSAYADAEETRLRLIETAEQAFFDYYLVARQQDLIRWDSNVLRQFRDTAQNKYRANQVTQQDMLQADVELAQLERRQLELERMNTVAMARVNTLLRQPPDAPLPAPPQQLSARPINTEFHRTSTTGRSAAPGTLFPGRPNRRAPSRSRLCPEAILP